jgi:hypothetical protein
MDGWPGDYLKQPLAEPEFYAMHHGIAETHNGASEHTEVARRMLDLAERCCAGLGDTPLNRKGSGVRGPGRLPGGSPHIVATAR